MDEVLAWRSLALIGGLREVGVLLQASRLPLVPVAGLPLAEIFPGVSPPDQLEPTIYGLLDPTSHHVPWRTPCPDKDSPDRLHRGRYPLVEVAGWLQGVGWKVLLLE